MLPLPKKDDKVILSDGKQFYHGYNPTCPYLGGKDPAMQEVTRQEAERQGYVPCPACRKRPNWV